MTIKKAIITSGIPESAHMSARRAVAKIMTKAKGKISTADYNHVIRIMDASRAHYV